MAKIDKGYSVFEDDYVDRAENNAKNLGLLADSSIPRLVIVFGF